MICPVTGTRCESTGCTAYIDGRCGKLPVTATAAPNTITEDSIAVSTESSGTHAAATNAVPAVEASGTPRTDALDLQISSGRQVTWLDAQRVQKKILEHARTLERELAYVPPIEENQRRFDFVGGDNPRMEDGTAYVWAKDYDALRENFSRLTRDNATFRAAQKACETCDGPTMAEVATMRAKIESMTRELEEARKLLRAVTVNLTEHVDAGTVKCDDCRDWLNLSRAYLNRTNQAGGGGEG